MWTAALEWDLSVFFSISRAWFFGLVASESEEELWPAGIGSGREESGDGDNDTLEMEPDEELEGIEG